MEWIPANSFNFDAFREIELQKRNRGNQSTNKKKYYKDVISTFDIETTNITQHNGVDIKQNVMYMWQWQIGIGTPTVIGRTWDEFLWFIDRIIECLDENVYLVVFVHNLSYEFQYLSGILDFNNEDIFAIKSRKVLKVEYLNKIEFRCSYYLSNMSLSKFLKEMKTEHQKLDEHFDYNIQRFSWTELSESDINYAINDVVGLCEAITIELEKNNDSLYSLPLTSTGYVRRDMKKNMRTMSHNLIPEIYPDVELYILLREAFRGGDTHANRYYVGKKIKHVESIDIVSSYPNVICNYEYPMSKFKKIGNILLDECIKKIKVKHKAMLIRVSILNISLINIFEGAPYISLSKCRNVSNAVVDNGRILSADYLETTLTDIDLMIVLDMYKYDDLCIFNAYQSRYGKLPLEIRDTVIDYFIKKTDLKGIDDFFYMKSKNKINACYGMMAQNPVKPRVVYGKPKDYCGMCIMYKTCKKTEREILLNKCDRIKFINDRNPDIKSLLEESKKKSFILPYQWGVWTTAHARNQLNEGRKCVGFENFIYCDTDSVKYIYDANNLKKLDEYNEYVKELSISNKAIAKNRKNELFYMGVYEKEPLKYDVFATLGAKKYVYEAGGELHITISGVVKHSDSIFTKGGDVELKEKGGIDAFINSVFEDDVDYKELIFTESAGLDSRYNDNPDVKPISIDGHFVEITKNIYLSKSTYKMSISSEYERVLKNLY